MCYDAGVGKYPIMGGRYTMDTYPRLAKELDLAWAPDKSRIPALGWHRARLQMTFWQ